MLAVTGIEADYDAGQIGLAEAERRLREAGVAALLYTTPSHTDQAPRWRVFAPFGEERSPEERKPFMERLNGIFDGTLDGASFTLSQSYYGGNVDGRPAIEIRLVDGRHIDLADDLDAIALPKGERRTDEGEESAADESGSGALFRLAGQMKREGASKEQFESAVPDHREAWAHVRKEEKAGKGRGQRAIDRAWGRAEAPDDLEFEDLGEDGDSEVVARDLSENGLVEAFSKRFADKLRFDHHAGKWFIWTGSRWEKSETQLAHEYARQTSTGIAATKKAGNPAAKALKRVSTWEAVERASRRVSPMAVTSAIWDADPWLLGTPGGTVDLRSGELRPARQADMITKQTAVAPVPLDRFEPSRDCPTWLGFLDFALAGDADAIRFLQQWLGYSLTGDTREQALLFVHGRGGTGKGTAINGIADVMGDYAINIGMETLTASKHDRHTTELARLRGARMARASETEEGRAWAENRIKALTGGDTVTARFMRQDDFEFVPEFKLTIFGNNRPAIKNVDEAIRRRFNVLPFDQIPPVKDLQLAAKLKTEWPGMLSWAIRGCLDWQRSGLVRPPIVLSATESYFEEQDTFGLWLGEECEIGKLCADTTENLWESWERYARSVGEQPGSRNKTFPESMQRRGFRLIKNTMGIRGRGFSGVRCAEIEGDDFDAI